MKKAGILFTLSMLIPFSFFSKEIIQNPGKSLSSDAGRILENKNIEVPIRWSNKKDLPVPRIQGHAVACDNFIYYIGSRDSRRQKQNAVFRYDPGNDDWTACAPMPTPRWNFALAENRNKIYVMGGDILISTTEVYDPGSNSWETLFPLPTQRVSAGCVAIGDLIYVIGGWEEDTRPSVKNEAFNTKTQKWEIKAPLPSPRMSFGTVSFKGKIYILGGTGEMLSEPIDGKGSYFFKPEKTVFVYNPQEDSWEKLESEIPIARIGADAVSNDNFIFFLGGYTVDNKRNESFLTRVDIFDPKRNIWLRGTDLPEKLLFSGIAVSNNSIYVIGGWDEHYRATSIVLEGKPILSLR